MHLIDDASDDLSEFSESDDEECVTVIYFSFIQILIKFSMWNHLYTILLIICNFIFEIF